MQKKIVILHDIEYTVGGPKAVLNGIEKSLLNKTYKFIRLKQKTGCGYNPFRAFKFVNHYRKLINSINADTIYICGLQYTGLLMTIAAKLSNIKKIVVSVHGSDWDNPDYSIRKRILMYIVEPLTVLLANSVFTVCEAAQHTIGALKVAPNHNMGTIYNTFPNINYNAISSGIFRTEQSIDNDKIIVSVVGRVVKAKGHEYIIEAIKNINNPQYIFIIVGEGDYIDKYRKECSSQIDNGQLRLLGVRNDVPNILRDTDIFLFATLNENHSMALLEAVNMRCAAIVTNVGGNPEIISDGESGLLIPPRNSKAIIKSLNKLSSKELRKKYSEEAYNTCKIKFSVEKTYGKLGRILNPNL